MSDSPKSSKEADTPEGQNGSAKRWFGGRFKWPKLVTVLYVGAVAAVVGSVLTYGAMEATSASPFCGTCHIMHPYYDSWEISSHSDVDCVDCHIAPGEYLQTKIEASSMVTSYFTGTYGTKPWADVSDESCYRCHERERLGGHHMYGDVRFDHGPHLADLSRGKELRCTSCHGQVERGVHISVTASTCMICHFKDQVMNQGMAECTLCHQIPVMVAGAIEPAAAFDHTIVQQHDIDCKSCHKPADAHQGTVPQERCLVCHNDAELLTRIDETDALHQAHVNDHQVECTNCHLEIEHVVPHHDDTFQRGCASCHDTQQSPQQSLYAGRGGVGVDRQPDVMYEAHVRCEGCHLDPPGHGGDGEGHVAGRAGCVDCHGEAYGTIYDMWKETLAERVGAVRRQVNATASRLGEEAPQEFRNAVTNLELVERGKGVHNFNYSIALLDAAIVQINEAREQKGLNLVTTPWLAAPFSSDCLSCHIGVENRRTQPFGQSFWHAPHVVRQGLECETCHSTHDERDAGAPVLKITAGDCTSCHHEAAGPGDCRSCHAKVFNHSYKTELGEFSHGMHADDLALSCVECHGESLQVSGRADRDFCSNCH